jgi:hypothetical protein
MPATYAALQISQDREDYLREKTLLQHQQESFYNLYNAMQMGMREENAFEYGTTTFSFVYGPPVLPSPFKIPMLFNVHHTDILLKELHLHRNEQNWLDDQIPWFFIESPALRTLSAQRPD